MAETYFISDIHFNDPRNNRGINMSNISGIEYMIKNWNSKVEEEDIVIILGDILCNTVSSTYSNEQTMMLWYSNVRDFIGKLNGRKKLILGNHDVKEIKFKDIFGDIFETILQYEEIEISRNNKTEKVILFHYPISEWRGFYGNNTIHIHGHTHGTSSYIEYLYTKYYMRNRRLLSDMVLQDYTPPKEIGKTTYNTE